MTLYCIRPILGDPIRVEVHHHDVTLERILNILKDNGTVVASFNSHDWRCIHVAGLPGWGCEVDPAADWTTKCQKCDEVVSVNPQTKIAWCQICGNTWTEER